MKHGYDSRARLRIIWSGILITVISGANPHPAGATHPCTSPLILDLDGHGVETTGIERPVQFDVNGDGVLERIGWTSPTGKEAFLWVDGNHNNRVDHGGELFGTATLLPSGEFASNGFDALEVYDRAEFGGNGDGWITREDLAWSSLRLWIDEDHDGVSHGSEIATLSRHGVVAIHLEYENVFDRDGHGNMHAQRSTFIRTVRRFGRPFLRSQEIEDVFFILVDPK